MTTQHRDMEYERILINLLCLIFELTWLLFSYTVGGWEFGLGLVVASECYHVVLFSYDQQSIF